MSRKYIGEKIDSASRHFWIVMITVIVTFVALYGAVDLLHTQSVAGVDLQSEAVGTILHEDGSVDTNLRSDQWTVKGGDRLTIRLTLPDKDPYKGSSLVFHQYNSAVIVSVDGKSVFSYGTAYVNAKKQIGNLQVVVPIDADDWGKEVTITCDVQEKLPSLHQTELMIMPSFQAGREPLMHQGVEFIIFFALMIAGLIGFIGAVISSFGGINGITIGSVSAFCFLAACWYFGYHRLFYVISGNTQFNALAEYVSLDLCPVPYLLYMRGNVRKGILLRILNLLTGIVFIYSTGSLLLIPFGIDLASTLPGLQILIGIILIMTTLLTIASGKRGKNTFLKGVALGMAFAVLQIIMLRMQSMAKQAGLFRTIAAFNYGAIGLIILIMSIVMSAAERFFHDLREQTEKEELEKLAYLDILTGIPNRSSCVEKFKALDDTKEYVIGFFDVDFLKKANDQYGHDVGDALIKTAAGCLKAAFGDTDGFFGRWGGDEFVACFYHNKDVQGFRERFDTQIHLASEKAGLPIAMHVSSGYAVHDAGDDQTANDVINAADEAMYQDKTAHKAART
jgi:diguanylate cyclase (GGDEF)-like protein